MTELPFSRRPVPGTELSTSVVGIRLDPVDLGRPGAEDRAARMISSLRSRGVTTFDVGEGEAAARAERLLARALKDADEQLVVLARRSLSGLAREASRERSKGPTEDLASRVVRSLEASTSRLGPHRVHLLVWDPTGEEGVGLGEVVSALERVRSEGHVAGWVFRIPRGAVSPPGDALPQGRAALYEGRLSLLDRELLPGLTDRWSSAPFGFFAEDPYGAGRLDGSRFPSGLADRPPGSRPPSVAELQREFDPVLQLGFLTSRPRRTLAQVALQFALHWPWVCSALVPLPSPERLTDLEEFGSLPPLTEAEVARVLGLST
jgi:aryl-alcohol dehydrogenase-like predicted oxidoreductase